MLHFPSSFLPILLQVTSANAFAQTLRRYTSLNHLAQAARAVLQNTAQINQMLSDLNRVDFANVQVGLAYIELAHVKASCVFYSLTFNPQCMHNKPSYFILETLNSNPWKELYVLTYYLTLIFMSKQFMEISTEGFVPEK